MFVTYSRFIDTFFFEIKAYFFFEIFQFKRYSIQRSNKLADDLFCNQEK